jgi:hypothetical protein
MEQKWEGVYDHKTRDEFFRQSVFYRFSGELLQELGITVESSPAYVCFQVKREKTVFRLNSFLPIPAVKTGS